jgi:hypothetical protein
MLSVGIVGKPNAGKSTLFNALTNQNVPAENYPFCTIDKNVGVVPVPDKRLDKLQKILNSEKKVPATVTFVDIAGLVEGASKGQGLGNKFLSHIKEVDLVLYLLNSHEEEADPVEELEIVQTELVLKDLESINKKLDKLQTEMRDPNKKDDLVEINKDIEQLQEHLNNSKPALSFLSKLSNEESKKYIEQLQLLTAKDFLIGLNISESTPDNKVAIQKDKIKDYLSSINIDQERYTILVVNAKLEHELSQLSDADRLDYIEQLEVEYLGLPHVIRACYDMLGYITFYTGNEKEVNGWQIIKGKTVKQAAGAIHSDLEDNFIRADVGAYEDFVKCKGWTGMKDAGKLQSVGKEYIVNDGDMILIYAG